jgi:uncharacterized protein (TIGR00645 family)
MQAEENISDTPGRNSARRRITDYKIYDRVEMVIFDLRYMLLVVYIGTGLALCAFVFRSFSESVSLILHMGSDDGSQIIVGILERVDELMVANVGYLIVAGSYLVYIRSKLHDLSFEEHEDRPPALRHLSSGNLKEKMAASLMSVSAINLLKVLIEAGTSRGEITWKDFVIKVGIHLLLIVGFWAFGYANRADEASEKQEPDDSPAHSQPATKGVGHESAPSDAPTAAIAGADA